MVSLNNGWVHIGLLLDRSGSMEEMNISELAGSATTLVREQSNSKHINNYNLFNI